VPPIAGERAAAVCYRDGYEDFVGRGVVDANFHAVEVAADKWRHLCGREEFEADSGPLAFFGKRE